MLSVKKIILIAAIIFGFNTFSYEAKIIAATGVNGHLLPAESFLTNISPVINGKGDIAFNVVAAGNQDIVTALFHKKKEENQASFQTLLPEGLFASDLTLNDFGIMSTGTHDGGSSRGLFTFDTHTKNLQIFKEAQKSVYAMSSFHLTNAGNFAYRLIEDSGERAFQKRLVIGAEGYARELLFDNDGKISYLFSHELKENFLIFKLRYGAVGDFSEEKPDRLWLYDYKKEAMQIIAADMDATGGSSKIRAISNQYTVASNGKYAFWATTKDSEFVLYLSTDKGPEIVLKPKMHGIESVDPFSPTLNIHGDVLIRGKDENGANSLFLYLSETKEWKKLLTEKAQFILNEKSYELISSRGITFIGRPSLSDNKDIVFNAFVKELASGEVVEAIISLYK